MKLKELINALRQVPGDTIFPNGFGQADSWRGAYTEIAFAPVADAQAFDMLGYALSAEGSTYLGYKGGKYRMNSGTEVNIAAYGEYTENDPLTEERWEKMLSEALAKPEAKPKPNKQNVVGKMLLFKLGDQLARSAAEAQLAMTQRSTAEYEKAMKTLHEDQTAFITAINLILPD